MEVSKKTTSKLYHDSNIILKKEFYINVNIIYCIKPITEGLKTLAYYPMLVDNLEGGGG